MAKTRARIRRLLGFAALLGGLAAVASSGPTVLATAEDERYGTFLVDEVGATLYAYAEDEPGAVACTAACATMWPPLLVQGGEPAAGDGLDPDAVGTVRRPDGTIQVAYGGNPLYRSASDRGPGDVSGHDVAEGWHLVDPNGRRIGLDEPPEAAGSAPTAERMRRGERVYLVHCAECHGVQGDERADPRAVTLAGNERAVGNAGRVARQIVRGGGFMPPFGRDLSNDDVAAVATYVRNAWGNDYGEVTTEDVEGVR